MAYLYRHIRLDKNEPFYIGIGSNKLDNYERAYWKYGRNGLWKAITNKTEYKVEIILDDLTWDEACCKEVEFIKLYGRKNNKTGCLANLTDGGEGILGNKHSIESKIKMSESHKGKSLSEETRRRIGEGNKNKIVSLETKIKQSKARKGHKQKVESIEKMKITQSYRKKKVDQFDLDMNFIKTYDSISELIPLGFNKSNVIKCCKDKIKTCKNYIFKYNNTN